MGQDKRVKIGDGVVQGWGDGGDAVSAEIQSLQSMVLWEVCQSGKVVVCEIDGIFVLAAGSDQHCARVA